MPPRSTPPLRHSLSPSPFPPNDSATYRDLLLFEERLKSNAASLQARKSRYQLFLLQLLLSTLFLLIEIVLPPESSLLLNPYRAIHASLFSSRPDFRPPVEIPFYPYLPTTLLLISLTTLVLFFASGMYSEKIAYANKYVPHANRALRSFNMYLNVRKPGWSLFFWRKPRAHSPPPRSSSRGSSVPIAPIPPSSNPRGELIFSSRISQSFQDSYGRHRATFERKRAERARQQNSQTWLGKFTALKFWDRSPLPVLEATPTHVRTGGTRGRISRSGTPPIGRQVERERERSGSPPLMLRERERGLRPSSLGAGGSATIPRLTAILENNIFSIDLHKVSVGGYPLGAAILLVSSLFAHLSTGVSGAEPG
ncbi:uncharacterized protein BT62DRAFT_991041 [Guyanagaster necrorhizus]|uniref:Transmembrane protein 188 n=1 Tax=Guyanagaster necrorhizus TaxID=856835 RepID=A0A9P7W2L2_9AGAR|nr:uncharacterized protein BT62DRAFT_991041 [Guyanagaster necrorhizus MCA 3950]KAG7451502.1 hypothetical protein BT62DRAFT_991041 [Guyanagaster necrorhizus MCA 3950]